MTSIKTDERGLTPAIVQDAITGRVLMLGWMSAEALERTQATREVWFFSRSRSQLWRKGETSGNALRVVEVRTDCDADAILVRAIPAGPTCHTGQESCFYQPLLGDGPLPRAGFLDELEGIVAARRASSPDKSYTAKLFAKGRHKIAQKVGEEGVELAMAGVAQDDERVIDESADLLFHLLVLLNERNISMRSVLNRLAERHSERVENS